MNVKGIKGKHNHIHNYIHGVTIHKPVVVSDKPIAEIIGNDALLRTDNLMTRQSFQGRFKKSSVDRKGRSGYGPEQAEANGLNQAIDTAKAEMVEAALAADVIVETDPRQPEDLVGDGITE